MTFVQVAERPGSFRHAMRVLLRRRATSVCLLLLALMVIVSIFAEQLASNRPIVCSFHGHLHVLANVTRPPELQGAKHEQYDWAVWPLVACSARQPCGDALVHPLATISHPLGTDGGGRDVFARLVYGTRSALAIALLAVVIFVALGAFLGAVAGFFGGGVDFVVARAVETLSAFPVPLLALVVQALVPRAGVWSLVAVIAALRWTEVARLVRAEVLSVSSLEYVVAARALGASPLRVLYKHILPQALSPIIVSGVLGVGRIVMLESALDFLRVGLPPNVPTWGQMLSESRDHFGAWWLLIFPATLVFASLITTNTVGEALRDALDPRTSARALT